MKKSYWEWGCLGNLNRYVNFSIIAVCHILFLRACKDKFQLIFQFVAKQAFLKHVQAFKWLHTCNKLVKCIIIEPWKHVRQRLKRAVCLKSLGKQWCSNKFQSSSTHHDRLHRQFPAQKEFKNAGSWISQSTAINVF